MLKANQILVRSIALAACAASLAALAACGQKGPLYLPTDPAGQSRATLPETLGLSTQPASADKPVLPATSPKEVGEIPASHTKP